MHSYFKSYFRLHFLLLHCKQKSMGTPFHLFTSSLQQCVLLWSLDKRNYSKSFPMLFILLQKDLLRSFFRQTQVEEVILVSKAVNKTRHQIHEITLQHSCCPTRSLSPLLLAPRSYHFVAWLQWQQRKPVRASCYLVQDNRSPTHFRWIHCLVVRTPRGKQGLNPTVKQHLWIQAFSFLRMGLITRLWHKHTHIFPICLKGKGKEGRVSFSSFLSTPLLSKASTERPLTNYQ